MKTLSLSLAAIAFATLVTAAANSAIANDHGLTNADPQFVNAQSLTDTYVASAAPARSSSAQLASLTDAERGIIVRQQQNSGR